MNISWIGSRKIVVNGKNSNTGYALVDNNDYEYLSQFSWHGDKDGYPSRTINIIKEDGSKIGRQIKMHNDVFRVTSGNVVDHINRKKYDNRKSNLREVTPHQNCFNRGAKGITWQADRKRWAAYIQYNGKAYNLGRYINKFDAIEARKDGELKYFGGMA